MGQGSNEVYSERRALFAPGVHLNWRANGVSRFESSWSILQKLAYLNGVGLAELRVLLGDESYSHRTTTRCTLNDFGYLSRRRLQYLLKLDPQIIEYSAVARYCPPLPLTETSDVLRYCPICIGNGFHTPLFQVLSVVQCPIHGEPLMVHCTRCKSQLPYELNKHTLVRPYACSCGTMLWPGLNAAEWRPSLTSRQAHVIEQYIEWLDRFRYSADLHLWHLALGPSVETDARATGNAVSYVHALQPIPGFTREMLQRDSAEVTVSVTAGPAFPPVSLRRPRDVDIVDIETRRRLREGLVDSGREYYAIYKSLRRHLRRRYLRGRLRENHQLFPSTHRDGWDAGFSRWIRSWDGEYLRGAPCMDEWIRALKQSAHLRAGAGYLHALVSTIERSGADTQSTAIVVRWIGARWIAQVLVLSFYNRCRENLPDAKLPVIGIPCFRWQPATRSSPHRLTWWTPAILDRLDALRVSSQSRNNSTEHHMLHVSNS